MAKSFNVEDYVDGDTPVFVYGTLLEGFGNWKRYLAPAKGTPAKIEGFVLGDLGYFPGINHSDQENDTVFGEIYLCTEQDISRMDVLEGYREGRERNMYEREEVLVTIYLSETTYIIIPAQTYVYNSPVSKLIESGNWKTYTTQGI